MVEIKGERSAGEPCAETSEENCLNGGVGVEPSSVGDAVWARGGGAGETEDVAEVGKGGGELKVRERGCVF